MKKLQSLIREVIDNFQSNLQEDIGVIICVRGCIAEAHGLINCMIYEKVFFENGTEGVVIALYEHMVSILISGNISAHDKVFRTGKFFTVKVNNDLIGGIVNGLGKSIDGRLNYGEEREIYCKAPSMLERLNITRPLYTGITKVDLIFSIGRGQRTLILGSENLGQDDLIIDICKSRKEDSICVYVAIGRPNSFVLQMYNRLQQTGIKFIVVAANDSDSVMSRYFAPSVGCAIAEYFREQGKDVIIFYDSLNAHAIAYREISLINHQPVGRESYPGDLFYIHASLLERAGELKNGSITAFPLVYSYNNDIAGYLPTNIISITDGQLFFKEELYHKGILPAIDIGISVSRIGGAVHTPEVKSIAGFLKLELSQYELLVEETKLISDINKETKKILESGKMLFTSIQQPKGIILPIWKQLALVNAARNELYTEEFLQKVCFAETMNDLK